jgi:hypothetical protein
MDPAFLFQLQTVLADIYDKRTALEPCSSSPDRAGYPSGPFLLPKFKIFPSGSPFYLKIQRLKKY